MSDYRYSIVQYNGIDCLHVMIDAGDAFEGIAETHILLSDILASYAKHLSERENVRIYQQHKQTEDDASPTLPDGATGTVPSMLFPAGWNTVNGKPFDASLPDGQSVDLPEMMKLPEEMRGKP